MNRITEVLHYFILIVAAIALLKISFLLLISIISVMLNPGILGEILADLKAIRSRDPAAEGWIAAFSYPGFWALSIHRLLAHPLYQIRLRTLARLTNFGTRFLTGTDIHPGAQFGRGIFIDHAHGVVIGETAILKDNVTILHQVTLGGTGKETGKRHPTIEEGVLISAGSKVLGNITVGKNAKIGAGSVVVKDVPPDSTVVGVPGRVVATKGERIPSMTLDQTNLPDPVIDRLVNLQRELRFWEKQVINAGDKNRKEAIGNRDILAEIVAHKKTEVDAAKARCPIEQLKSQPGKRGTPRSFHNALKGTGLSLIAEIKKASPSGGLLRLDFNPSALAKTYQNAGASAISVLTDEKFFQGHLDYLAEVREATNLPLLRKDFIVDSYQIIEAERAGADAILLIVACLSDEQLRSFRETAEAENMDALVEVHDEMEMQRALKSGAKILGINNRNLKTLETTLETTFNVLQNLPDAENRTDLITVSESGIKTPDDTMQLNEKHINAVLIGETFMRAEDIETKVREIMGTGDYSI